MKKKRKLTNISTPFDYSPMPNYMKKGKGVGRGQLLSNVSISPNLIHFLRSLQTNLHLTPCRPSTYCAPLSIYNNFYVNHNIFLRKHAEWLYINPIACFWITFSTQLELDGEINQIYVCIYIKNMFLSGYLTTFNLFLQTMHFGCTSK